MSAGLFRENFTQSRDLTHLNNAGLALLSVPAKLALEKLAQDFSELGAFGIVSGFEKYHCARASFARILGCQATQVAMTQNCSSGLSQIALGMNLCPGDEILTWDQEYPSCVYPWHAAAQNSGAKVKTLTSESDFSLNIEKLLSAIQNKTRAVVVSWVQFQTGAVVPLKILADACHKVGAWLVVDAIQGLGVMPFEMNSLGVDAVSVGTHKWLCGPLGFGFFAVAEHRIKDLNPVFVGAMSYDPPLDFFQPERNLFSTARRFEPGAGSVLNALSAAASVDLILNTGVSAIHKEALRLSCKLSDGLLAMGHNVLTPNPTGDYQSPIVTFVAPRDQAKIADALRTAKISFAERGGGIRLSPHAFNTDADIDKTLATIQRASK